MKVELLGLAVSGRPSMVGRLIVDRHDDASSTIEVIIETKGKPDSIRVFSFPLHLTVVEACRLIGALQGSETLMGAR